MRFLPVSKVLYDADYAPARPVKLGKQGLFNVIAFVKFDVLGCRHDISPQKLYFFLRSSKASLPPSIVSVIALRTSVSSIAPPDF